MQVGRFLSESEVFLQQFERRFQANQWKERSRRFFEIDHQLSPCDIFRLILVSENSYGFLDVDLGNIITRIFRIKSLLNVFRDFAFGARLTEDTETPKMLNVLVAHARIIFRNVVASLAFTSFYLSWSACLCLFWFLQTLQFTLVTSTKLRKRVRFTCGAVYIQQTHVRTQIRSGTVHAKTKIAQIPEWSDANVSFIVSWVQPRKWRKRVNIQTKHLVRSLCYFGRHRGQSQIK